MSNARPLVSIVKESTPEAVKATLLHWHLVKEDRYLAWEDGKFGRYCRDENGNIFFDSSVYPEEELGEEILSSNLIGTNLDIRGRNPIHYCKVEV